MEKSFTRITVWHRFFIPTVIQIMEKALSGYDQEMTQLQTTDGPTAPRGRGKEQ